MLFFAFDSAWPGEYDRLLMIRAKALQVAKKSKIVEQSTIVEQIPWS